MIFVKTEFTHRCYDRVEDSLRGLSSLWFAITIGDLPSSSNAMNMVMFLF